MSRIPPHSGTKVTQQHQLLKSDLHYYDAPFFPEHNKHIRICHNDTNLELDPRTTTLKLEEGFTCQVAKTEKERQEKKEKEEEKEIEAIITAQSNPHRRMASARQEIGGFEPILNRSYQEVWSAGNFFRNTNYQKGNIFYEQPYKDI